MHCPEVKKSLHHQHDQVMLHDLIIRLWVCILLTIPILFLSPMVQPMVGMLIHFHGQNIVTLLLSTIIFLYGGKPFLRGMKDELMQLRPGMMTLVAFSITIAYIYSSLTTLGFSGELFFLELATLIDIMLLGHWVEMRAIRGTSQTLERLALLLPAMAHKKYPDGSIRDVETAQLAIGDLVVVRPGEKISADGIIIEGESEINEAALTGEMVSVFKNKGKSVIAGAVNGNGALIIEVNKSQEDAYISRVIKLVAQVMESKSSVQNLANKAALYLTIIALSAGITTFFSWLYAGTLVMAFQHSVAVMVTACPHALGLAIPLVLTVITSLCAKNGLFIRNRIAFEQAKDINVVMFDKTGTLTEGNFEVTDVITCGELDSNTLLAYAAAVEQYAKHAIADAIVSHVREKKLVLPEATKSKIFPGKGACSIIQNKEIFVGNDYILGFITFANDKAQAASRAIAQGKLDQFVAQGKTAVFIATSNGIQGIIALADAIRPESYQACTALKNRGIRVVLITGDNKITAQVVARKLEIETVLAEILPDQKATEIQKIQKTGQIVAMVGDGINDAPAIAVADVGIAIGAGTDIALETAGIILVKNDPRTIIDVIELSELTRRKMLQNLFWATGYNIVMIPIATGFFTRYGITMNPAIGALLMSLSTIIVAFNARFISYKR